MKTIHYQDIEGRSFSGGQARDVTGRVAIGKDDGAPNFCMRVFTITQGGFTPRHSHAWEHEIFIHSGTGELFCDGNWHEVSPGMALFVPPDAEHQLRNTNQEDFTFVCLIPKGAPEL